MKHKHKKEHGKNPFAEKEETKTVNGEEKKEQEPTPQPSPTLQEDFDNLNSQYIRLAADFDNYRKRQAQEREGLIAYGAQDAMTRLIDVLDNFDRAKQAIDNSDDVQQIKESFNVLYNHMFDNLSKLGLEVIQAQGQEFNPNFHEAVMQTPTGEYPENHVIMELQKGYKLGDKVLRPTLVNVATNE